MKAVKALMKRFFDLPYRTKLLITHMAVVLLVILAITAMITLQASAVLQQTGTDSLVQLTEQVLINFTNAADSAENYLYSKSVSTGAAKQMGAMAARKSTDAQQIELVRALSNMIDVHSGYSHVMVRLENGQCVGSFLSDSRKGSQSELLLNDPANQEKRFGHAQWVRTEDGEVYLLRDVYDTAPLHYVGKMCAHMKKNELVSMGSYNTQMACSVIFFNEDGQMIVGAGPDVDALTETAAAVLTEESAKVSAAGTSYAVCRLERQGWTAIGFLPMDGVAALQDSVLHSGLLAALMGLLLALAITAVISRQMTGQIQHLVDSMHRVEAGDLNVSIPVEGGDEIGVLTGQFNRMTAKMRGLIDQLVAEEKSKRRAEYQNLAYEYRFLHWQINPHFIYNALETINALAKIDGNDELSDMIVMLSAYFRQNADAMRKKVVTVEDEFASLEQYAEIYRCIYGSSLRTTFRIEPQVCGARLPTMIIQPLLENALVHGRGRAGGTDIVASAQEQDGRLVIRIEDDGAGMTQEMIDRVLGRAGAQQQGGRTSLGVRNVLDRLHLLYGASADMDIASEPGHGTCVTLRMPLYYDDAEILPNWEQHSGA